MEQNDSTQRRRQVLTPQEEVTHSDDGTPGIDPSHLVVDDVDMMAPDDNPTRQNMLLLHTNRRGEEGASQETAADVGHTDGLDKDVAVPTDGATIPPHEG